MEIKRALRRVLSIFLSLACASPISHATSSDTGTLTPGEQITCPGGGLNQVFVGIGFNAGVFGTYSPIALTGGRTVTELRDVGFGAKSPLFCGPVPPTSQSFFQASGFTADPGSSWLISVTCNGVQQLESAAIYDGYSGGKATWEWPSSVFGFVNGTAVSCTIVHN